MERQMEPCQLIERSIIKKYRKELWTPFIVAVKRYELVQAGDKIAVCISGGKDSMLMAKLMQELQRHSDVPFELVFLVMNPGYNEINRQKIESNAALLNIPITIFETDVFAVANNSDKSPCYLCARMRRGYLYKKAQELGCNKIALGHHYDDAVETFVMNLFHEGRVGCFSPVTYLSRKDLTMIRPLIFAPEREIASAVRKAGYPIIKSQCPVDGSTQREWTKNWLRQMEKEQKGITKRLFGAMKRGHISDW